MTIKCFISKFLVFFTCAIYSTCQCQNYADSTIQFNILDEALYYSQTNYLRSLELFKQAVQYNKQYCDLEMLAYTYLNRASIQYILGYRYEASLNIDSAIRINKVLKDSLPLDYLDALGNATVINTEIKPIVQTLSNHEKLIHQSLELSDTANLAIYYFNYAQSLVEFGDYSSGNIYFNKSINSNKNGELILNALLNKIELSLNTDQLTDIPNLQHQATTLFESTTITDPILSSYYYRTIARIAKRRKQYDISRDFLNKAILAETNRIHKAFNFIYLAEIELLLDNEDSARSYITKALHIAESIQNDKSSFILSEIYNQIGFIYMLLNGMQKAFTYFDRSISYNSFQTQDADTIILSYREYITSLLGKLKTKASISPSLPLLSQAVQLIHEMRNDIRSLDSKIESSKRAREIYNLAVPDALKQFKKTDSSHYFDLAFYWADLSKGGVLSEQIARDRIIRRYENDTLYQHYVELTSDIHALRKQIIDQKNNPDHQLALTEAQELIIQKRQELKQIEDITDFNHHLIKPNEFISFKLNNASATLQVYKSDSSYFFLIHLTDGTKHYNQVDIASLNPLLLKHLNYQSSDQIDTEDFLNNAQTLYQIIFPENINWEDQHHLTIVPDGLFHQLSVESLVLPDTDLSLKSANYLFKNVPISYSLGLHLTKPFQKNQTNSSVLAVAPNFKSQQVASQRDCSEEVFGSLTCNTEEVEFIASIYDGRSFLHDNATVENFTSSVDQHQIIHLATHACIDTTNYYKSAIVFNDGQILMSDLYNLDWQNKTVVLSACNTAHGSEVSGEGVFNFARTLTELGCKEVVVSLWPIDDCSTAKFIKDFYSLRKKYHHTSLALQKARSRFIKNSDKLHSMPIFWAPLIVISNDEKIGTDPSSFPFMWSFLIAGALLCTFLVWRHFRNQKVITLIE